MKKIIWTTALLSGSSLAAHAQTISAGTISLGGNVGYSASKGEHNASVNGQAYSSESKLSRFAISPSVGYFFTDNFAVGLSAAYTATRTRSTTYSPAPTPVLPKLDPNTSLRVGPYVQYYKMLSEQFGLLGTLAGGWQRSKDYDYANNTNLAEVREYKSTGLYADLTPGIIFFPIPKLGLNASIGSLGYSRMDYEYPTNMVPAPTDYEYIVSSFGARFGLDQLQFGGTYYFGR